MAGAEVVHQGIPSCVVQLLKVAGANAQLRLLTLGLQVFS